MERASRYCLKALIMLIITVILNTEAPVAQWIEHRIPNP
jgi:hypothetical protein